MNTDVLTTKVTEGIAVITMGSAKRMYFDAEMGDALTESLQEFAGDHKVRVVIVTGGAPGYFNRHFSILPLSNSLKPCAPPVASGPTTQPTTADSSTRLWHCARACPSLSSPQFPAPPLLERSNSPSPATSGSPRTAIT